MPTTGLIKTGLKAALTRAADRGEGDRQMRSGWDVAQGHDWLKNVFSKEELKKMRVLVPGDPMEYGATYFDLTYPEGPPFVSATPNRKVPANSLYVAREGTDPELWQRLVTHRTRGTRLGGTETGPD